MITEEEKGAILKEFESKCDRLNLSFNVASKQIGISGALISLMRNQKWEQISEEKWRAVSQWCGTVVSTWKLRETANLLSIQSLCEDAQENSRFLAVSAATGLGKTTALTHFANNRPNTFYVLGTNTMGRTDFLNAIQKAMGMEEGGSIHKRMGIIIKKLNSLDRALLIVDDTSKIPDSAMRLLQVIYDQTEFRTGLVIAGTEHLKRYIEHMAARDKMGFRELKRRIGYWLDLKPIHEQWLRVVCNDFGIVENSSIRLISKMVDNYGSLRELLTNYQRAKAMGKLEGMSEAEAISSLDFGSN